MNILVVFFETHTSVATGLCILLAVLLVIGFLTVQPNTPRNLFYSLHESTTFDERDIGTYNDKYGNKYSEALVFDYGNNDLDVYRLDGAYTQFSGTVFVPENRADHENDGRIQLSIYGDGKKLWVSPHMQADTKPVDFCINVTGVKVLDIRYDGGAITWDRQIGIGNILIESGGVSGGTSYVFPTRLLDMDLVESSFICRYPGRQLSDFYGNTYDDCLLIRSGKKDDLDVYQVDGGVYTKLTGIIMVPNCREYRDEEAFDEMFYVRIYADGVLVYTSPRMVMNARPVAFSVDISGCKEIAIGYYAGDHSLSLADIALCDLLLS